jgi:Do/DeqQ family serine protease
MKRNILVIFLSVVISVLTSVAVVKHVENSRSFSQTDHQFAQLSRVSLTTQSYPDFTYAAEKCVKAVVHVKVMSKSSVPVYSLFDFFFGYNNPQPLQREQLTAGSGVIIHPDGYIVTNSHVVSGADEISITLENNQTYKAKLIGADEATDIALIKIDAKGLPYLEFGDSDSLRLGEWVIAIGNPYNLTNTITAGIVSAKRRSMSSYDSNFSDGKFRIESFIQTDAAVNPGNSGGALVNVKGELVGINTAIASRTGSFTGYSFAVPASIAKKVVNDFMNFGEVKRAMLGVSMQEIDSEAAKRMNMKDIKGVLVTDVMKGGAADKSGIKPSDIILSINGQPVNSSPAVQEQISKYRPNDKINVEILRDGKSRLISVILQEENSKFLSEGSVNAELQNIIGATLQKASKETLKKLLLRNGVEVTSVGSGKFREAGIKPGFIITYINQVEVNEPSEVLAIIKKSGRSLLVEGVYPDGRVVYYGMGL